MRLYGLPYSAYCVKVRIALRLKGLAFEEVPPPDGYRSDAYRRIVATGTIPALVTDDGLLVDSNAIVEYLDETHPPASLLPADPVARARSRAAAGYHDTRLEPLVRPLFPLLGDPVLNVPEFEQVAEAFSDRLSRLEALAAPAPLIAGPSISIGDLGFPWTIAMAERLLAEAGVTLGVSDRVRNWLGTLGDHAAVAETLAEADAGLSDWLAGKAASRRRATGESA